MDNQLCTVFAVGPLSQTRFADDDAKLSKV